MSIDREKVLEELQEQGIDSEESQLEGLTWVHREDNLLLSNLLAARGQTE